jgi:Tol biopolymer transport system component
MASSVRSVPALALAVAVLVAAGSGAARAEQHAAAQGRVAFVTRPFGGPTNHVYVVNVDGTGRTLIRSGVASCPQWSPDGTRIALDEDDGILIVSPDGSVLRRLARLSPGAFDWSPDGRSFLVSSYDRGGGLFVMDVAGTRVRSVSDRKPFLVAWSPTGRQIALVDDDVLYVTAANGGRERRLSTANGYTLAWSPDGRQIAFGDRVDGDQEVFVIGADGSGRTNLSNAKGGDLSPDWSPDGSKIAYIHFSSKGQLYVTRKNGADKVNLSAPKGSDSDPVWSPDGQRIAHVHRERLADSTRVMRVYVMNSDGSGKRAISQGHWNVFCPAWSPGG